MLPFSKRKEDSLKPKKRTLIFKILYSFLIISIISNSPQNALSQVLNNKTNIIIDANGRKTTERTILVKINKKQFNWLSHIEIGHNPKQEFSFKFARVLDSEGNFLRKLKKKDILTRNNLSYSTFYQDDLITEFDLYWNEYPYQIEYSYTITEEEFLNIVWWTPLQYTNVPTIESSLEVNVPTDYSINIKQSGSLTYTESQLEDKRIYQWKSSLVKKTKDEIYSPHLRELIPKVLIVPVQFKYGIGGSSDSWSSFGLWLNHLNEGTDRLPLNEKIIIEELINGIDDKKEIIKKVYYYLQDHTRYVNVAIDVGGLKSYPASYVSRNKYGDCKALTTYMKSMLKSVDIESYYTVINAGENDVEIDVEFPSQQFNHVILVVPLENDTIWIENTSNSLPFNYLGTFTQNRYALAINGEISKLIRTPKLYLSDVLIERYNVFTFIESDICLVNIELTLRGNEFEKFRHNIASQDELNQKNEVVNHVNIEGFNLNDWNTVDYHRDNGNIKIDVRGKSSKLMREIGSWKVINPLNISIPNFDKPSLRHLEVRINYPINKSDKSIYEFNNLDLNEVQLPEGINIENVYGKYSTSYTLENNKVTVYEKFSLLKNIISVDQYNEFYSFIRSISNHKKKSAILIK